MTQSPAYLVNNNFRIILKMTSEEVKVLISGFEKSFYSDGKTRTRCSYGGKWSFSNVLVCQDKLYGTIPRYLGGRPYLVYNDMIKNILSANI